MYSISPAVQSEKFVFLKSKDYKENFCLLYPSPLFNNFVEILEKLFNANIHSYIHRSAGVVRKLYDIGISNSSLPSCGSLKCRESIRYIVKLYITVRVHFKLKLMNRDIAFKRATKRNRKAKKILHM